MDLVPKLVKSKDNKALMQRIALEELKIVMEDMEEDKALGSSDFNAKFIKVRWEIVHKDLLKMVLKYQQYERIGGSTNSAFLVLIPKEKYVVTFDRYRPISLCNIGYKIITKIMENRLKTIMLRIIPENQGSFIKGRRIWDNIILVQEEIHSILKNHENGMVVKLDLANAFNRVCHPFLF